MYKPRSHKQKFWYNITSDLCVRRHLMVCKIASKALLLVWGILFLNLVNLAHLLALEEVPWLFMVGVHDTDQHHQTSSNIRMVSFAKPWRISQERMCFAKLCFNLVSALNMFFFKCVHGIASMHLPWAGVLQQVQTIILVTWLETKCQKELCNRNTRPTRA